MFNPALPYTATPITNQWSSGRCWLFASTNVVRYTAAQKLGMAGFQFSQVRCWPSFQISTMVWILVQCDQTAQSYVFFWDKLEKCNYYLELSIELTGEPLDSRIAWHLTQECGMSDGGQ